MPPAHLKGALVDKYAEIALFDAAENQRVIIEAQQAEVRKKAEMKAALDMQVRLAQEAVEREKLEDREWVRKEQERIAIWNREEMLKIETQKNKEETIRRQREQQLRELAALRERERSETQEYEMDILRSIHKEIKQERAKEQVKRASDAENLRQVALQNVKHQEHLKVKKRQELDDQRKLEATWTELLDKQERQRERQLKATYARQARQYGAASSMQEVMDKQAKEDEERANYHARELEKAAAKREADQKSERARLQQETLDVLSIQVREKASRSMADKERENMVVTREREDIKRAEKADTKRRNEIRSRNAEYAKELSMQMAVQEERKVLEPYLMSKAERQMNAALLRKLPVD
jgi:hypothetical protein